MNAVKYRKGNKKGYLPGKVFRFYARQDLRALFLLSFLFSHIYKLTHEMKGEINI